MHGCSSSSWPGSGLTHFDCRPGRSAVPGQRRPSESGLRSSTSSLGTVPEPASEDRAGAETCHRAPALRVPRPSPCPPPTASFLRLLPFLPPLFLFRVDHSGGGEKESLSKERISDVEEKRGPGGGRQRARPRSRPARGNGGGRRAQRRRWRRLSAALRARSRERRGAAEGRGAQGGEKRKERSDAQLGLAIKTENKKLSR